MMSFFEHFFISSRSFKFRTVFWYLVSFAIYKFASCYWICKKKELFSWCPPSSQTTSLKTLIIKHLITLIPRLIFYRSLLSETPYICIQCVLRNCVHDFWSTCDNVAKKCHKRKLTYFQSATNYFAWATRCNT